MAASPSTKFRKVCRQWDIANTSTRDNILRKIYTHFASQNVPRIEEEIGDIASLLFTRITTSLRLSYSLGCSISRHIQAIDLFVRSTSGQRFLSEFTAFGGLQNLLDVLEQRADVVQSVDKSSALKLLNSVCQRDRSYRKLLCKAGAVKIIRRLILKCEDKLVQQYGCSFLGEICKSQEEKSSEALKALMFFMFNHSSISLKKIALQEFRAVISIDIKPASEFFFQDVCTNQHFNQTLVSLFSIGDSSINYEVIQILQLMIAKFSSPAHHAVIASEIVAILKANFINTNDVNIEGDVKVEAIESSQGSEKMINVSPSTTAARVIGELCQSFAALPSVMIAAGALRGLVICYCNTQSYEAQRIAHNTLKILMNAAPSCVTEIQFYMGNEIFRSFMINENGVRHSKSLNSHDLKLLHARIADDTTFDSYMKEKSVSEEITAPNNSCSASSKTLQINDNNATEVIEELRLIHSTSETTVKELSSTPEKFDDNANTIAVPHTVKQSKEDDEWSLESNSSIHSISTESMRSHSSRSVREDMLNTFVGSKSILKGWKVEQTEDKEINEESEIAKSRRIHSSQPICRQVENQEMDIKQLQCNVQLVGMSKKKCSSECGELYKPIAIPKMSNSTLLFVQRVGGEKTRTTEDSNHESMEELLRSRQDFVQKIKSDKNLA